MKRKRESLWGAKATAELPPPKSSNVPAVVLYGYPYYQDGWGRQADADVLADYSVDVRYPGYEVNRSEVKLALAAMERVRKFVRRRLG